MLNDVVVEPPASSEVDAVVPPPPPPQAERNIDKLNIRTKFRWFIEGFFDLF
jgi:hypothetical protein